MWSNLFSNEGKNIVTQEIHGDEEDRKDFLVFVSVSKEFEEKEGDDKLLEEVVSYIEGWSS